MSAEEDVTQSVTPPSGASEPVQTTHTSASGTPEVMFVPAMRPDPVNVVAYQDVSRRRAGYDVGYQGHVRSDMLGLPDSETEEDPIYDERKVKADALQSRWRYLETYVVERDKVTMELLQNVPADQRFPCRNCTDPVFLDLRTDIPGMNMTRHAQTGYIRCYYKGSGLFADHVATLPPGVVLRVVRNHYPHRNPAHLTAYAEMLERFPVGGMPQEEVLERLGLAERHRREAQARADRLAENPPSVANPEGTFSPIHSAIHHDVQRRMCNLQASRLRQNMAHEMRVKLIAQITILRMHCVDNDVHPSTTELFRTLGGREICATARAVRDLPAMNRVKM